MKSKSKKNMKAKLLELYTERDNVNEQDKSILSAKIEMLTWVLSDDNGKLSIWDVKYVEPLQLLVGQSLDTVGNINTVLNVIIWERVVQEEEEVDYFKKSAWWT